MKISIKIIGLTILSFVLFIIILSFTSINVFKQIQTDDTALFKNELLELAIGRFENSSNQFFLNFEAQNDLQDAGQSILSYIEKIDPKSTNVFVFDIVNKKFVKGYTTPEITTLLSLADIDAYLHQNLLNQSKDFDRDNFEEYTADTTNSTSPIKVHIRIYKNTGLLIGYSESFPTIKVRLQYVVRQNESLYNSNLNVILGISIFATIIIIILMNTLMRRVVIRPLEILASGLKQVQEGNLETKIAIKGGDEMAKIATGFNSMTSDLVRSGKELKEYSKKLEEEVKRQTKDFQDKNIELESMNKAMMGRELKMVELKREIEELRNKVGVKS
ncbi:MAG: HAMP domain-containing protein [Candidatus Dojkabacteria bacterium]